MDKDIFELRELEKDLLEMKRRQSARRKFETILKLYTLIGFIIGLIGMAFFAFITIDLNKYQQMVLIVSGTGLVLSFASLTLLEIRRKRMDKETKRFKSMQYFSDFVWKWYKFETISKETLSKQGKQFNKYSIRAIIEILYDDGIIDSEDVITLEEAIQARNMLVHGGGSVPKEMLFQYSYKIDEVINKIKKVGELNRVAS